MKIGVLLPIGRMDKFGYQYDDFTKIIIDNLSNFADFVLVLSSSRFIKKELFEKYTNIKVISNDKTWFKMVNGEEIFSWKVLADLLDFGCVSLYLARLDSGVTVEGKTDATSATGQKEHVRLDRVGYPLPFRLGHRSS